MNIVNLQRIDQNTGGQSMISFIRLFNVPLQRSLTLFLLVRINVDNNLKKKLGRFVFKTFRLTVIVKFAFMFGILTSIDVFLTIYTGITSSMKRLEKRNKKTIEYQ